MRAESYTVKDLMRREVVTVPRKLRVRELAETLYQRGISGAPVVDEGGRVVGVVSATDILRLLSGEAGGEGEGGFFFELPEGPPWFPRLLPEERARRVLEDHTVAEIMMPARFTIRPDASVEELARFLLRARIHRALVYDRGELMGIVTAFDVLRALAGEVAGGGARGERESAEAAV